MGLWPEMGAEAARVGSHGACGHFRDEFTLSPESGGQPPDGFVWVTELSLGFSSPKMQQLHAWAFVLPGVVPGKTSAGLHSSLTPAGHKQAMAPPAMVTLAVGAAQGGRSAEQAEPKLRGERSPVEHRLCLRG